MNILIVEDDAYCAQSSGEIIESWGHKVEKARSGKEALQRFTKDMFDMDKALKRAYNLHCPGGLGGKEGGRA